LFDEARASRFGLENVQALNVELQVMAAYVANGDQMRNRLADSERILSEIECVLTALNRQLDRPRWLSTVMTFISRAVQTSK
jgi:hypothetical protein